VISLIKAFSSKPAPLALVGPDGLFANWISILAKFENAGIIIGGVAFAAITFLLYRWILRMARPSAAR
jgi:hypothetical protein